MDAKDGLTKRHLLLGISGGIAAYKTPDLVRKLTASGFEVQTVMTQSAGSFVAPMSLQAVSGRPVRTALLDLQAEADGMGHIELARWAHQVLVAPASADFIARLAAGRANDLLSALLLATEAPIAVAPAMNKVMWEKPQTQRNIARLHQDGVVILGPDEGQQACGEVGFGRMLEPEALCHQILTLNQPSKALAGLSVVITAGPTQEAIDPVRFISNRSSGKQGYSLADACQKAGAKVTLISGPTFLPAPAVSKCIAVISAEQMRAEVFRHIAQANIFIGTAAVGDYRPVKAASQKIKKSKRPMTIELVENCDIIAEVAALPEPPYVVGFAAETHDSLKHAKEKLARKKLNMIVLNDVSRSDIGFDGEDNEVAVITAQDELSLPKQSKRDLSVELVKQIASHLPVLSPFLHPD